MGFQKTSIGGTAKTRSLALDRLNRLGNEKGQKINLLDFIFPKSCFGCGINGGYLCKKCVNSAPFTYLICPYCKYYSIDGGTHYGCQRKQGLDGLISIWKYDGVIRKAILALKYKYVTEVEKELVSYFFSRLKYMHINIGKNLVPIPMYWRRENVRGFNQSAEIGKQISILMGWDFTPDLLVKKKATISQVELTKKKRCSNLKNVFTVIMQKSPWVIPKSVILFDDVFTTGSTLMEATKILKHAGVKRVWGLTLAR